MSRQPSPGLPPGQQTSYYRDAHGIPIEKSTPQLKIVYRAGEQQAAQSQSHQQGAPTPIPIATSSSGSRTRSKAYQSGIAAGAEDVKYAAKYRDLKQKVKEIEGDNDRLVFKVLQAKRNIQRAKLERAILYERLGALPASPPQGNAPLPSQHVVQQSVAIGGQVSRHSDAQFAQSGRHQRASGQPVLHHHHHRQHHQQPIQPAPTHVSPPQHHPQAHHPHPPPRDPAHPGQLPITHAQQVTTIPTADGPLVVVAGPDGHPVQTADGHYIPAQEIHHHPPPSSSHPRKRGGRVSKEVREMREREAREMREREEMERKQAMLANAGPNSGHPPRGMSPPHQAQASGPQGQVVPISSREQRDREREWEIEREIRERERIQRRDDREEERERGSHSHHHHHHTHGHGHGHRHHQHAPERNGSPPPLGAPGQSPEQQVSPPPSHRSHSQASHASYRSHHSHSHHIHSHSHSGSPLSPGGSSYPSTRIHNHQRIGPGSYVLRDRDRADVPPSEAPAPTPVPSTPMQSDDASTTAPTPVASTSRVPTPPYMRPGRTDVYHGNTSPPADEAKPEARPNEEGAAAHNGSAVSS